MVERQTMKFFPTKQYRIVPECDLVYRNHENILAQNLLLMKILLRAKYPLYGT